MVSPTDQNFFLKLTLKDVPTAEEDAVSFKLFEMGAFGVSLDLSFKQENQRYDPEILSQEFLCLQAFFNIDQKENLESDPWLKSLNSEISVEKNKDWLKEWKKHFKPFQVFPGLWIVPSWLKDSFNEAKDSDTCIFIEPGLAFGTGTHATTKLCLKAISKLIETKEVIKSAVYLGSGSSVLSIYLKQCGVDEVLASEIDPLARENGRINLELNDIKNVDVLAPNSVELNREFDLVVANIIDGVLLDLREDILSKKAKTIILSGILIENEKRLIEAFTKDTGYKLLLSDHLEEWSLITLKKN
jgi:ribosomal protein L11 methyltransferase